MLTMERIDEWRDHDVIGASGDKVGTVADVYYDDETGRPEWLLVERGFLGMRDSFVPLAGARIAGDAIAVAYPKDVIKDAPDVDADGYISDEEELRLMDHYGISSEGRPAPAPTTRTAATVDTDDDSVTLAEERIDIGKIRRPRELVRLKKVVKTENVDKTVPVAREEIRVEREPVRGEATTADIGDDEATMVAYDEDVVADKHVEAKERVRLEKDVDIEEKGVDAKVRKEDVKVERDRA